MKNQVKLYNTKTKTLEDFISLEENSARIYSCGPTVYHYAHIGNLRAYVFADVLRRTLTHAGYAVKHVINITDVGHNTDDGDTGEDKMEKGSRREGKTVWEIAQTYTEAYFNDLNHLGIPVSAYTFPRATDTIPEQIQLVQQLESKGYTYLTSDGVYFDTSKFEKYGDLARLDIEGLKSGARVEDTGEKKNITDFALWKFSPTNEKRQMEWESPWGIGFPGWHLECSAMAMKYLGNHFDIHTGGIDHIPVHHTNEIAQSVCATGEEYANYWMHVNFLHDTTGKMSKSNEDFLTLDVLISKGYSPLAYKYFLLTTHYRKEVTFSYEALDGSSVAYKKLTDWCVLNKTELGTIDNSSLAKIEAALNDDIGTATAIAELWNLIKDESIPLEDRYQTVLVIDDLLGLGLSILTSITLEIPEEVAVLIELRGLARATKNFAESDRLRDQILALGFSVKDTSEGQSLSAI